MYRQRSIVLVVPVLGIAWFVILMKRLSRQMEDEASVMLSMFILFVNYGGLLLTILTTLFWLWSGMAALGAIYLLVGGPFSSWLASKWLRPHRDKSEILNYGYYAAMAYLVLMAVLFALMFLGQLFGLS